jgi:NADPH2:quinone reductase
VNADHVGHVPRRMDLLRAGAATVTALTALQGIDDVLNLRQDENVLIFGATGAVGTMAVQFARRRGARVIATATGRKATQLVVNLGADARFDARADDAVERLRELVPKGLDAVLAFAGGRTLDRCLDLVKPGGRVAYPNGVEPEPKRRRRRFSLQGYDGEASRRHFARLERAADEARLQVPIAAAYPLARAARAHERLERGGVVGRIVLRIARAR